MDVRFLSVEFLNTYLTTYRVFSDAIALFDTLLQWYYTRSQFEYPKPHHDLSEVTTPTGELSPKGMPASWALKHFSYVSAHVLLRRKIYIFLQRKIVFFLRRRIQSS